MQRRLAPLAAWNALAWGATAIYGFLVAAVVCRCLGVGAYGVLATISALRGFLLLVDGGLATGISRDVALIANGDATVAPRIRTTTRLYAALGAVALAGTALLAWLPAAMLGLSGAAADAARITTWLFGVETALALLSAPLPAILRGRQRFDLLASATIGQAAVGTALLCWLVPTCGLVGAGWAALIARFLVAAPLAWFVLWRGWLPAPHGETAPAAEVTRFALPLWIAAIGVQLGLMTDVPIVGWWFGEEAASAFALGARLPGAGASLLFAVLAASFPRLVSAPADQRQRLASGLLCLATTLAAAGFGTAALHANGWFELWVGTAQPLAVEVLWLYALTWTLHAPAHVLSSMAIALGRHRVLSAIVLAETFANLGLSLWLAAAGLPTGPALATLATLFVSNVVVVPWLLVRELGLDPVQVVRPVVSGGLFGGIAAAGGALGACLLVDGAMRQAIAGALIAVGIAAIALDLTVRGQSTLRWLAVVTWRRGWPVWWRQWRQARRERQQLATERRYAPYVWIPNEPPLVTVRIATYRRGPLVAERAIASALAQTHRNLEVLVVGDCCDEATAQAVLSVRDPRVRFVNLPERGRYPDDPYLRWMVAGAAPMNHALKLLRGEWIAPLDDDDEFTPDHVAALLDACRSRELDFAWGKVLLEERDGSWSPCGSAPLRAGQIAHVGVLYSARLRRFEHDIECWRLDEPGDWNLWRRFRAAGVRMGFVDHVVARHYREMREVTPRFPRWMGQPSRRRGLRMDAGQAVCASWRP